MRADARRNRERLLAVAETVFAEKGVSASTEEVARAAGVGIGTVFRHFPTKEALLAAVFVGRLERLAAHADLLSLADDPGAAFAEFFTLVVNQSAAKNAFADALTDAGMDLRTESSAAAETLKRSIGVLLARAQHVGAIRGDVGPGDVTALLVGAARTAEYVTDPAIAARTLAVILDGLRPL